MNHQFYKYHGTGNDFILIDNRKLQFVATEEQIKRLCHRRFGIGADGLICLEMTDDACFKMVYFNSDGKESTFCGNGGRCIVAFAHRLGIISANATIAFLAKDGLHEAVISGNLVTLHMRNVATVLAQEKGYFLDTGSPHYVQFVESVDGLNVKELGEEIRYSERFREKGVNVNFVERIPAAIKVRTYERGVEDETFSCGTGVTASALVAGLHGYQSPVLVQTPGGNLEVRFQNEDVGFSHIQLIGPTVCVFTGMLEVSGQ